MYSLKFTNNNFTLFQFYSSSLFQFYLIFFLSQFHYFNYFLIILIIMIIIQVLLNQEAAELKSKIEQCEKNGIELA